MPWDDPVLTGSALPPAYATLSTASTSSTTTASRSSLADALARFDSSAAAAASSSLHETLRRRTPTSDPSSQRASTLVNALEVGASRTTTAATNVSNDEATSRFASVEERLAQHRQSRIQRLSELRRDRNVVRSLLGGTGTAGGGGGNLGSPPSPPLALAGGHRRDEANGAAAGGEAGPSMSPRSRRFAGFLRALAPGNGGGGRGFSMFDDFFDGMGRGGGRFGAVGDYMVRSLRPRPLPFSFPCRQY